MDMLSSIPSKSLPFDSHIGVEDGEIGVFRAEKYFNGGMDNDEGRQRTTNPRKPPSFEPSKNPDKLVLAHHLHLDEPFKAKPWLATPSVGSESCSINSQKPLLKLEKNNTNNNHNSKSFLSNALGYYCMCYSCNDKPTDDVGEISFSKAVTAKPPIGRNNRKLLDEETPSFRENPFSFQTGSLKLVHFPEEEVERKSLEVFGSPVIGRHRNKPFSLEKKLAMLSWDHTNNNSDEVNSDCSSDLFEIESLTKQTNPFQSPTASCYAPSEASVEWSVVTASALDFDERRLSTTSPARVAPPPRRVNVNEQVVVVQKRRSSSLLGCKSEKAVRVAEDNINGRKITAKVNSNSSSDHLLMERQKLESSVSVPVPVKRFEDETKVRSFSFRSQAPPLLPLSHRALATHSLPRPYSPRLSNIAFNMQ